MPDFPVSTIVTRRTRFVPETPGFRLLGKGEDLPTFQSGAETRKKPSRLALGLHDAWHCLDGSSVSNGETSILRLKRQLAPSAWSDLKSEQSEQSESDRLACFAPLWRKRLTETKSPHWAAPCGRFTARVSNATSELTPDLRLLTLPASRIGAQICAPWGHAYF